MPKNSESKQRLSEGTKVKLFNVATVAGATLIDMGLAVALIPTSPFIVGYNVIKNSKYKYIDGKYVAKGILSVLFAPVLAVAAVVEDAVNEDRKEKNIKYTISVKRVFRESGQRIKNYDAADGKYTLNDLLDQEQAQRARKALEEKIKDNLYDFSDLPEETLKRIIGSATSVNSARKTADTARQEQRERQVKEIAKRYPNLSAETINLIVNASQYSLGGAGQIYEYLRRPRKPYDSPSIDFYRAVNYGDRYVDGIQVDDNDTWISHAPMNWNPNAEVLYHISLNTHVTRELIESLDNIVIQDGGRIIYNYKFPSRGLFDRQVLNRHDPITVYTKQRDTDIEQKIVKAAEPYVRSDEGLIGEMLGKGVDISIETSNHGGPSVGQSVARMLYNYIWQRGKLH